MSRQKPKYEVADIFRNNTNQLNNLTNEQWKVVNAILNCRTAALGGHDHHCDSCSYEEQSYNSCGNRHCPKCGALAKEKWLNARMSEFLPVQYFHVVFTIPHDLNEIFLFNKKELYGAFLKSVKNTIIAACHNKKNIGATAGLLEILHTWGQNLDYHIHTHCIVPGGGLKNGKWISCKKDYFVCVKILSKLFKGKFLEAIKKLNRKGILNFPEDLFHYQNPKELSRFLTKVYKKDWVVYAKETFSGPEKVLEYLCRYTHRVAISNYRIKKICGDDVFFSWKDYRTGKNKVMKLSRKEFMRRFLLHVIPFRFVKIRFCGFLSNRCKKKNIKLCRDSLCLFEYKITEPKTAVLSIWEKVEKIQSEESQSCPKCRNGKLITNTIFPFYLRPH